MSVETQPPVKRTESALYRRSGTILVAGLLIVVAALLQLGFGGVLLLFGDELLGDLASLDEVSGVLRTLAIVYVVFGLIAAAVAAGVFRVRAWARGVAIAYAFLTMLYLLVLALRYGAFWLLTSPNVGLAVQILPGLMLAFVPGVGDAFREAKAERDARRDAPPAAPMPKLRRRRTVTG